MKLLILTLLVSLWHGKPGDTSVTGKITFTANVNPQITATVVPISYRSCALGQDLFGDLLEDRDKEACNVLTEGERYARWEFNSYHIPGEKLRTSGMAFVSGAGFLAFSPSGMEYPATVSVDVISGTAYAKLENP